jgi:hypothetical protein
MTTKEQVYLIQTILREFEAEWYDLQSNNVHENAITNTGGTVGEVIDYMCNDLHSTDLEWGVSHKYRPTEYIEKTLKDLKTIIEDLLEEV